MGPEASTEVGTGFEEARFPSWKAWVPSWGATSFWNDSARAGMWRVYVAEQTEPV